MNCLYISYDGVFEPLGQSQILPYLKGLSKKGIKFVLLSFDKKGFKPHKACAEEFCSDLKTNGIKLVSLRYHKSPLVLSSLFDIVNGIIRGFIIIKRDKIGIIHARGYVSALIAVSLKKMLKVKFIFDMRGFWADEKAESSHWKNDSLLYKTTKYLEGKFIKSADEVVVLTKQAKSLIESRWYHPVRISAIPCCVDTAIFKPDPDSGAEYRLRNNLAAKFIFVHTGSLEDWYMKSEMLDYFKVAKEIIPNAHFLILSQSPKDEIWRMILKKGLSRDDFTMLSVPFSLMPGYLSAVDAGIIFLSLGFSKIGCFPTKFAEFLSCGIPVVASSGIGDTQELISRDKVGVIVNSFDPGEYKRNIEDLSKLIGDNHLKSRCRQLAERQLALDIGVKRYSQIYLRLNNELSG